MTILVGEYCCRKFEKAWNTMIFAITRLRRIHNAITEDGWYMRDA
jgi:hypothetical protein